MRTLSILLLSLTLNTPNAFSAIRHHEISPNLYLSMAVDYSAVGQLTGPSGIFCSAFLVDALITPPPSGQIIYRSF